MRSLAFLVLLCVAVSCLAGLSCSKEAYVGRAAADPQQKDINWTATAPDPSPIKITTENPMVKQIYNSLPRNDELA